VPTEPSTTVPATTTTTEGGTRAYLYFNIGDRVVGVVHELESKNAADLVGALAAGPTRAEVSRGLVSQLPPGLEVRSAVVAKNVLSLDLSSAFDDVVGQARSLAAAEIVLSVTQLPGIREVSFSVDGQEVLITSPVKGDTARVDPCDFRSYIADDSVLLEVNNGDRDVAAEIEARQAFLFGECPNEQS
jgi:hypothetical protein